MKTAKEILHEKAAQYKDGFLPGQMKWLVEAMHEYGNLTQQTIKKAKDLAAAADALDGLGVHSPQFDRAIQELWSVSDEFKKLCK